MTDPIAVLVEDDPEQAEVSQSVLEAAGYVVQSFNSIAPAQNHIRTSEDLIDLFVLDRRLPVNAGEPATDEFGDELLNEVRLGHPDARLIVFTGFATIRHVQESLQGSGQLPAQEGQPLDRVTVLEKDQSLEFKEQVEQFRKLLQDLDDIEIITSPGAAPLSVLDKRTLRRLAFDYGAASVSVSSLAGGMTDAGVWRCQINRTEGLIATVVAKRVRAPGSAGGLPELLPRANTTAIVRTISGLMAGKHVNVLQLAGESPYSLMDVIAERPAQAVELAKPVWDALHGVAAQQTTLTVAALSESLIAWERLSELLRAYGIQTPAGSLSVTTHIGPRHGDLHPGNVLIDNGQAVLIDFDSETFAAGLLDPITMLISTLVHPASPLCGEAWPDASHITSTFATPEFGQGHSCEVWFRGVQDWINECQTSQREYWALVLAYAGRQLQYGDVLKNQEIVDRIVAIAALAADALRSS
ncbi:phosphotransferase [Arthrobacter sp. 35/47]|uniref:phosphotransferase n=1 Tax=Arthrobacter sp. 35/47 TaxID=269454 RepID=UPI00047DD9E2|nr:phosphotransferase [Arthrobacter sp. 35/47]